MEKNKVSVIMGVYNCEGTVEEAIDSIIKQTYSNWELIICDDASTDNTYNICQEYKAEYPNKIKLIRNKTNKKLAYTLNRCLEYAEGYFIARMDGDDISKETRFEKQVNFLKKNPRIDLVGTAMQRFKNNKYNKNELADIVYCVRNPDKFTLQKTIPFNHATIMTYKYVYNKLNGYTVTKRTERGEDQDLWFRFFYKGFNGANLNEPLYMVRENLAAIERRTFKVRFNTFKTKIFGYKLLNYSFYWYFRAFITLIFKTIIPDKFILLYRKYQKIKFNLLDNN